MRITVAGHKGGVGKTTSAVMLAWLLSQTGTPTVLVDGDRQGSATTWWRMAEQYGEQWPVLMSLVPPTEWSDPLRLPDDGRHVVIDTGPGDPERVRAAASVSDVAVVASKPLPLDVWQAGATVRSIEASGCPLVGVLLTQVQLSTLEGRHVAQEMRSDGVPMLDNVVPLSVPRYARAAGTVPNRWTAGAYADVLAELLTPVEV